MKKSVGYNIEWTPEKACEDKKCPYHSNVSIRGSIFEGEVISASMDNTVIVQWSGFKMDPKYKRYLKTRSKVAAHNPECINAKVGDKVTIGECRPLSKTKHFVVLKINE
jgi:small subunit ribosomal protein S17